MGRVHKKKLAEYAEAAENEEQLNNKSIEKGDEREKKKNATVAVEVDDSDDEISQNVDSTFTSDNRKLANNNGDGIEDDDDDFKSLQGDNASEPEKNSNGKKATKRKATEKSGSKKNDADNEESDDDPLNGSTTSSKKARGGKTSGKAKTSPKGGKSSGRAKGKTTKKTANADDDDEDEEPEEEYEVKDIVDHKVERGISYFLIRWKGYTKNDDTWEAEDTLSCPDLISKFKKKQASPDNKVSKKAAAGAGKKGRGNKSSDDPLKEWEVDKIIDYAQDKSGRVFRIRWKGFSAKHDTWEPEKNLCCDEIIDKFMKRMKAQENVGFKELREEPKKTKRLVNETAPRTNYSNPSGRKSKRSVAKKRIYYGDSDE